MSKIVLRLHMEYQTLQSEFANDSMSSMIRFIKNASENVFCWKRLLQMIV